VVVIDSSYHFSCSLCYLECMLFLVPLQIWHSRHRQWRSWIHQSHPKTRNCIQLVHCRYNLCLVFLLYLCLPPLLKCSRSPRSKSWRWRKEGWWRSPSKEGWLNLKFQIEYKLLSIQKSLNCDRVYRA